MACRSFMERGFEWEQWLAAVLRRLAERPIACAVNWSPLHCGDFPFERIH